MKRSLNTLYLVMLRLKMLRYLYLSVFVKVCVYVNVCVLPVSFLLFVHSGIPGSFCPCSFPTVTIRRDRSSELRVVRSVMNVY